MTKSFYDAHKQVYGHAFEDQMVEIVTLRVVGSAAIETLKLPDLAKGGRRNPDDARAYVRDTVFDDGVAVPTPRYNRGKLLGRRHHFRPGHRRPAQLDDAGAARLPRHRAVAWRHARRARVMAMVLAPRFPTRHPGEGRDPWASRLDRSRALAQAAGRLDVSKHRNARGSRPSPG